MRSELIKLIFVALAISVVLVLSTALISITWERFGLVEEDEEIKPPNISFLKPAKQGVSVDVYYHEQRKIVTKDLETYLTGVVIAEMPPKFDIEALKAQAVVARTYTLSRLKKMGGPGCSLNAQADVCTDPNYCQAHYTKKHVKNMYSDRAEQYYNKISKAVNATKGKIITYQGEPLMEAPYHSTCGGKTETAGAVWAADHPFLKSIDCSYCRHSDYHKTKQSITNNQLQKQLELAGLTVPVLAEEEMPQLTILDRSETGRVQKAELVGNELTGHELRKIFDIPSTRLEWRVKEDEAQVVTRGFGHGVGLCQYGADGKAAEGQDYREIIDYYFHNTSVEKLPPD